MDLFHVYPQFADRDESVLKGRALRLIAVAGIVYDDESFYFELGEARNWGRLSDGGFAIGVGAPKVQPDGTFPPHQAVVRYVRKQWRCHVDLFPAGHSYLLDESGDVQVLPDVAAHIPYFFIFTPPRLGGADVPDALVQAVYLLPAERFRTELARVSLLKVSRQALGRFLEPESWALADVVQEPWAEIMSERPLPKGARLRPVLALRGLRRLIDADVIPGTLAV